MTIAIENEYIELWARKHGKGYCDYVLSHTTQLDELEKLARNIVFDGKRIKNIKLKQDHLALSVFTFFSGIGILFSSLFMPAFFENGSVAASSFGALTIFISSLINRRTLVNIRELGTSIQHDRTASSIEEHEIDKVKDELVKLIRSYTYYAPYACSAHIEHWHTLIKHTDHSSTFNSYTEEDVETLASEIFFKYRCSQEIKVHEQGRSLSLKKLFAGLSIICISLLCDKWYESSTVSELSNSHVPSIVSCVGAFITLNSILWYFYDDISLRVLEKDQPKDPKYEFFSPAIEKEAVGPVSSEIQVLSTTETMPDSRTKRK